MKKLSNRSRITLAVVSVFAILVITLLLLRYDPVWLFHRSELRIGNEAIAKVEAFRASHGRLPQTLEEVGMDVDEKGVYYQKNGENEYSVWFGRYAMGECESYNSRTKKWGMGC